MVLSLFLSGLLGTLQEKTYRAYGPVWKEGLFYTVSPRLSGLIVQTYALIARPRPTVVPAYRLRYRARAHRLIASRQAFQPCDTWNLHYRASERRDASMLRLRCESVGIGEYSVPGKTVAHAFS
jgi:hypothetical protein